MNKRNKNTCCCGTCQYWKGKRTVIEKENIKNNEVKVYSSYEKNGICFRTNENKSNNNCCNKYYKWIELNC